MDLTEKQKRILLTIINNAQGKGVNFLISYEVRLTSKEQISQEIKLWYDETKDEFIELEKIKEKIKNG